MSELLGEKDFLSFWNNEKHEGSKALAVIKFVLCVVVDLQNKSFNAVAYEGDVEVDQIAQS